MESSENESVGVSEREERNERSAAEQELGGFRGMSQGKKKNKGIKGREKYIKKIWGYKKEMKK